MKRFVYFIFICFITKWMAYPNEALKVVAVLEEKNIDTINRRIWEEGYARIVNDTVYTVLCCYDTTTIYRTQHKLYSLFFKEKCVDDFLHKRIFHIDEVKLADELISAEFNRKRFKFGKELPFYNYKFFSKSLYPYKDINGDSILIVSGYIRYEGIKNSVFPILYDIAPDFYLAKINVSKGVLIFLR